MRRPSLLALAMLGAVMPATAAGAAGAAASGTAPALWKTLPATPRLPSPDKQGFAAVDGARIWFAEFGVRHRGVPVLLLHGGLANADYFGKLVPALVDAGYHVIAMDSRGHGRSSVSTRPYGYALMARDVVALLDQLGQKQADIVGWSDGGIIGLELGLAAPARVHRLFAFGTNAALDGLRPDFDKTPAFIRYIDRSAAESRRFGRTPTEQADFLAQISQMWAREPSIPSGQLARIAVPITLALGQYDEAISRAHVEQIDAALPNSIVVMLPGVSHFAMIQAPAEFNAAVLSFLKWR